MSRTRTSLKQFKMSVFPAFLVSTVDFMMCQAFQSIHVVDFEYTESY